MFAGIYYGGMYGGSTTSILLNTPGESASIVTAIEGNRMARAGRGGAALATAAIGSFVAGLLATLALAFLAPHIVKLALVFGPREYFALMVLAFVTVSAAFGDSAMKGLTSLFVGLALALVGIDGLTGQARLSYGVPQLLDGIEVTTLAVAMFAIGEALFVAANRVGADEKVHAIRGSVAMTAQDWARSWKPWLRGTAIGFPIGAMPAGGADIASFLSYGTERKLTRHPEEFGNGAIEGWPGPRPPTTPPPPARWCAADARPADHRHRRDHAGGLPAVRPPARAAAFCHRAQARLGPDRQPADRQCHAAGAEPAPDPAVGEAAHHPAALALRRHPALRHLGTIGVNPSRAELAMLMIFGVMGYLMRLHGYPIAPVVVGLILGPMAEQQLRRALAIAQGDWTTLVSTPLSAGLIALAALALVVPMLLRLRGRGAVLAQVAKDDD